MRMKKCILFFLLCFLAVHRGEIVHAEGESGTAAYEEREGEESESNRIADGLLKDLELDEVQGMVDRLLGEESFSIPKAVKRVMTGNPLLSADRIKVWISSEIWQRFSMERGQMQKLLILILFAAIFSNLSAAFGQGQTGEIGFYVVYLLIFAMLMKSFSKISTSLMQTLVLAADLMKSLAPSYFVVLVASTGATTAALFYQGVLLLIWCVQWILLSFVLPACNLYSLLCLINALSKEEMLSKMADLLKSLITWSLNTMLSVLLGLQAVRSLVAPIMDHLKRSAIGKTASALPGVGNAINSVTELVLSCAVLVRNSLGIVFLMVFLLAGLGPLVHYAFLTIAYRFLAAVSQPISDKRLVGCLGTMGESCALLLRIFLTTEILCILTFVILMVSFGGNGV